MQKLAVLLVATAVTVAVSALLLWLRTPPPGVSQENFDRIQIGMSHAEVTALLGHSAKDPPNGPFTRDSKDGHIRVDFNPSGEVTAKSSSSFLNREPGLLDVLIHRLRLQWRRLMA
jgi:hypothetical protein